MNTIELLFKCIRDKLINKDIDKINIDKSDTHLRIMPYNPDPFNEPLRNDLTSLYISIIETKGDILNINLYNFQYSKLKNPLKLFDIEFSVRPHLSHRYKNNQLFIDYIFKPCSVLKKNSDLYVPKCNIIEFLEKYINKHYPQLLIDIRHFLCNCL